MRVPRIFHFTSCRRRFCVQANPSPFATLSLLGFPESTVQQLTTDPSLSVDPVSLQKSLDKWISFRFGSKLLVEQLSTRLELLTLPPTRLNRTFTLLSAHFNQDYVRRVFSNAPEAFALPLSDVEANIRYFEDVMAVPSSEVVNCSALAYPPSHIRTRHLFLERAGVYRMPHPKLNANQQVLKNPKLNLIVQSDDSYFSRRVAKLSLLEYEFFKELIQLEWADEEDSDSDSE